MGQKTIKDVAKAADVSIATVSRVINKNYPISPKLRARVEKAIEELNYRVNPAASSLKGNKSYLVGMVISKFRSPVVMELVHIVEGLLDKSGYTLLVSSSRNDPRLEEKILNSFLVRNVDAVIVITAFTDSIQLMPFRKADIPVVLVDRTIPGAPFDMVCAKGEEAVYNATRAFIEKGHKRIAILKGDDYLSVSYERYSGYRKAMEEAGIPIRDDYVINAHFNRDDAINMTINLFDRLPEEEWPTAFFTCQVLMAEGLLLALKKMGLKVPHDVSMASYGQMPISGYFYPQISFVRQDVERMGAETAKLVLERLKNGVNEEYSKILVDAPFIDLESIADI